MKHIQPSTNEHRWPRHAVPNIKCRKRDLVIRIADWSRQSLMTGEPALAVRRFSPYRADHRCFELFNIRTGECASFPGTKRDLEKYAKRVNSDRDYRITIFGQEAA